MRVTSVWRMLGLAGAALGLAACEAGTGGPGGGDAFVVTAIGDVAFARNRVLTTAESPGAWSTYTDNLKPLVIGDANFLNLEGVVTETSLGPGRDKAFTFQMHTTGLTHLVDDLGFNLMSTANNHSGDFGRAGQERTVEALNSHGEALLHHGVGTTEAIRKAATGSIKGQSVALAAIGISSGAPRPTDDKPGQWNVNVAKHWTGTLDALAASEAGFRVLSTHEGVERLSTPEAGVKNRFRSAQKLADLDLILAHHPHVPRGVEVDGQGRVIAYGLGNGLLHGAANLAGRGLMSDFGLMLRLYYAPGGANGPRLEAVEAIPLTSVHYAPKPFSVDASAARIGALNALSRSAGSERAMIFEPQPETGFGLWCRDDIRTRQARALCQAASAEEPAEEDEASSEEAAETSASSS